MALWWLRERATWIAERLDPEPATTFLPLPALVPVPPTSPDAPADLRAWRDDPVRQEAVAARLRRRAGGTVVTRDQVPYTYDAKSPLAYDPNGLDTEGIVRAPDGSFWLVNEWGPSLVHVSARGKVLTRYVPEGLKLTGADYPVVEALPGVLLHRKTNRGFEGLAQLPGGDLVMAVQSPLSLPDEDAGAASLTARLRYRCGRSG